MTNIVTIDGLAYAVVDNYLLSENTLIGSTQLTAVELETLGPTGRAKAFLALVSAIKQWGYLVKAKKSFLFVTTGFKIQTSNHFSRTLKNESVGENYVL